MYARWSGPVLYADIKGCEISSSGVLKIHFGRSGGSWRVIRTKAFPKKQRQDVVATFQRFYGRYRTAVEYQTQNLQNAAQSGGKAVAGVSGR